MFLFYDRAARANKGNKRVHCFSLKGETITEQQREQRRRPTVTVRDSDSETLLPRFVKKFLVAAILFDAVAVLSI